MRWFLILSLLLVACGDAKRSTSSSGGPQAASIALTAQPNNNNEPILVKFDWSPPCRVPVHETRTKKGKKAELAYELVLTPIGNELELRFENARTIAMDGLEKVSKEALNSPQARRILESTMLPLRISQDGTVVEVLGDATEAFLNALQHTGADISDDAQALTQSSSIRAIVDARQTNTWLHWVGLWLQTPLPPGDPAQVEAESGAPWAMRVAGKVDGAPDLVLVEATSRDENIRVGDMFRGDIPRPLEDEAVLDALMSRTEKVECAIEAHTGRPHRVRYTFQAQSEEDVVTETNDWTFDWSQATGCRKP